MEVICNPISGVIHKRARTAEERRRLGHEAAVLGAIAHPGVVQVVAVEGGDPPEELVLRRVGSDDLTTLRDLSLPAVAGLGAALATTVADLHDVGISHGAIEAAHVLLDDEGRPVLCSFGRAERNAPAARAEVARREDVRALARLLLQYLPPGTPSRTSRAVRTAGGPGRQRRCRQARWLARQLVRTIPDARLPSPPDVVPSGPDGDRAAAVGVTGRIPRPGGPFAVRPRRRGPLAAGRILLIFLVIVGAAGIWLAVRSATAHPRRDVNPPLTATAAPTPCPPVDAGCAPVQAPGGFLTTATGRYQVGLPGDVIVLGRWRCGPAAEPAVLRPTTGEVWTFAAWPTAAHPETGRLAARVSSAWSLRVLAERSGCDRLEVERRGLGATTIGGVVP